jgi:hypothetical protein
MKKKILKNCPPMKTTRILLLVFGICLLLPACDKQSDDRAKAQESKPQATVPAMPTASKDLAKKEVDTVRGTPIATPPKVENNLAAKNTIYDVLDKTSNPPTVTLYNKSGKEVVKQIIDGKKYTHSLANGKILFVVEFDGAGKPKEARRLCLDDNGNAIQDKDGQPIIVNDFQAETVMQREYSNGNEITTYVSCSNCLEMTENKCSYVFP